jgi:hypothetical protein
MGSSIRRSVKSQETRVKIIAFTANAAGTALTGVDALNVTMTDTNPGVKTIELGSNGFADDDYQILVTTATADSVAQAVVTDANTFVINTFDSTDGTTPKDAICHVLVVGKALA